MPRACEASLASAFQPFNHRMSIRRGADVILDVPHAGFVKPHRLHGADIGWQADDLHASLYYIPLVRQCSSEVSRAPHRASVTGAPAVALPSKRPGPA